MPRYMTQNQVDLAAKDYNRGKALSEIADRFGFSITTVRKKLIEHGVKIRPRGRQTDTGRVLNSEDEQKLIALYLENELTNAEALAAVGLPKTANDVLYSALRANKIQRKSSSPQHGKTAPDGHVTINSDGYAQEKVPADWKFLGKMSGYGSGRWILQHRKVMAEHLNRPLTKDDIVHHKNGNRTDNRIENLQLVTPNSHSSGQSYRCCKCGSTDVKPVELRT